MLPYETIIDSADRRWTFRLLERFASPDLSEAELSQLVEALTTLSDRRSVETLEKILLDGDQSPMVREAAGEILRTVKNEELFWSEATLRAWWASSDAVLQSHALRCMDSSDCPDIIREVAGNSSHALRGMALERMRFFFENPDDTAIKIASLKDTDPKVRRIAARILDWDEPVAAESALLVASRDEDERVATNALCTLQYYPTTNVLRRFMEVRNHSSERFLEVCAECMPYIWSCVAHALDSADSPQVVARLNRWLEPIRDLLNPDEFKLNSNEDDTPSQPADKPEAPTFDMVQELLQNPDVSPRQLTSCLRSDGWEHFSNSQRDRLEPLFVTHPDQLVRDECCQILKVWGRTQGLLRLADDPIVTVRKSAIYKLGLLPIDRQIADFAWDRFDPRRLRGATATEMLGTYVTHAEKQEAIPRLSAIAENTDLSENIRDNAIFHLAQLHADAELRRLLRFIDEPPALTWNIHVNLLEEMSRLGLQLPGNHFLQNVDHLRVQVVLAGVTSESC